VTKRYVPIATWIKQNGGSYHTVHHGLETGQIPGIKTPSNKWLIDTQAGSNPDQRAVLERLDKQERMLAALCTHLNVAVLPTQAKPAGEVRRLKA